MPKYNDSFNLDIGDIDLIETALRALWSADTSELNVEDRFVAPSSNQVKQIHSLLGKLSSQKIYYSEVNETGCPIG